MHERMLRISERIYSAMLVLYPKEFRDAYGPHMMQVFRDEYRAVLEQAGVAELVALWTRTVLDLFFTALAERRKVSAETSRIERLRHATAWNFHSWRGRKLSRSRLWFLTVTYTVLLVMNVASSASGQRQNSLWDGFTVEIMFQFIFQFVLLGMICLATGELLYARSKTLAGLLWLAGLFVFLPLALVVVPMSVKFLSSGTPLSTTLVMLYSGWLLITYGVLAWRYLFSTGSGNARQG